MTMFKKIINITKKCFNEHPIKILTASLSLSVILPTYFINKKVINEINEVHKESKVLEEKSFQIIQSLLKQIIQSLLKQNIPTDSYIKQDCYKDDITLQPLDLLLGLRCLNQSIEGDLYELSNTLDYQQKELVKFLGTQEDSSDYAENSMS